MAAYVTHDLEYDDMMTFPAEFVSDTGSYRQLSPEEGELIAGDGQEGELIVGDGHDGNQRLLSEVH